MDAIDTKQIAQKRYQAALDKIERAQNILSEAAGEIAQVVWADEEYSKIGEQYDNVKNLWRQLNISANRSKIDLDSDAKARLIAASSKD